MRCHICDSLLSQPKFNRDHGDWDPCQPCMDVISDTLSAFKDQAVWVEEDLPTGATFGVTPLQAVKSP